MFFWAAKNEAGRIAPTIAVALGGAGVLGKAKPKWRILKRPDLAVSDRWIFGFARDVLLMHQKLISGNLTRWAWTRFEMT